MIVKYNTKKLQSVLNDFHQITGIAIALCDTQFRYIVKSASMRGADFCDYLHSLDSGEGCNRSDRMLFTLAAQSKTPQIHRCHRGLWDMCVPVQRDGTLLAYMIMGRIRVNERLPTPCGRSFPPHSCKGQMHSTSPSLFTQSIPHMRQPDLPACLPPIFLRRI